MKLQVLRKALLVASSSILFLTVPSYSYAVEGHAGLDLSLSNETGNIGVYSLRETSLEVTTVGAEYFFNEPGDHFIDIFGAISRKGMLDNDNLELGIKGKVFYVDQNKNGQSGQGLLLGLTARYWIPAEMPVSVAAEYLYNPPIVAFGDVDSSSEFIVRGEVRMLPSVVAYVGFRKLVVDFDKRDNHELDKNVHIGVNVAFN